MPGIISRSWRQFRETRRSFPLLSPAVPCSRSKARRLGLPKTNRRLCEARMVRRLPYRASIGLVSGLTAALALAVPMAVANSDNETLRAKGIVGEWAFDCSRPPSSDNQTVEFSDSKGENTPTKIVRTGEREVTIHIRDV